MGEYLVAGLSPVSQSFAQRSSCRSMLSHVRGGVVRLAGNRAAFMRTAGRVASVAGPLVCGIGSAWGRRFCRCCDGAALGLGGRCQRPRPGAADATTLPELGGCVGCGTAAAGWVRLPVGQVRLCQLRQRS